MVFLKLKPVVYFSMSISILVGLIIRIYFFVKRNVNGKSIVVKLFKQVHLELISRLGYSAFHINKRILADKIRLEAYHQAIEKHAKHNDAAINLGTGTGIFFLRLKIVPV